MIWIYWFNVDLAGSEMSDFEGANLTPADETTFSLCIVFNAKFINFQRNIISWTVHFVQLF